MKKNKTSLDLNFLFFSLITLSIFPSKIFENLFNYTFTSIPIFTIVITIYLIAKNNNFIFQNYKNNFNILIFISSTLIICLIQSLVENNFIILIRYVFPIILAFIIYQYFNEKKNYEISNIFIFILFLFIVIYLIQKFNPLGYNDIICSFVNSYELILRGSCNTINVPTFLSTEPSYHSLNVFGLYIFYKLFIYKNKNNLNKRKVIDLLLIINLLIVESTLGKIFLLLLVFYYVFKLFIKLNINKKIFASFFVILICINLLIIELNNFKLEDKTVQSRFFYNFLALNNLELNPKNKFLNFKNNNIEKLITKEGLLDIEDIPVVRFDIYRGTPFNLNSSLIYYIYDFGVLLAIPFILFNIIILGNIVYFYNMEKILLILPYYIISFLAQSNFANIVMWIIFFYVSKRK